MKVFGNNPETKTSDPSLNSKFMPKNYTLPTFKYPENSENCIGFGAKIIKCKT
jgi:hypothetical protein